jgi:DNA-binding LacI/PurR family transcriptional regulator
MILPAMPTEMEILGLLVIGVLRKDYIIKLKQTGLPMLSVDIAYNGLDVGWICSANLSGGYLATKHLIDQGHRRLGFIGPIFFAESIYERYCGFMRAMLAYGLEMSPGFNILGTRENPVLFDTIPALEHYFANMTSFPDAWFCAGDRVAVALISILTQKGIRVPDDVSVIGFDDIPITQSILPNLTTIRIDRKRMGNLAVSALVNGKNGALGMQIPGELIIRDSVKKKDE